MLRMLAVVVAVAALAAACDGYGDSDSAAPQASTLAPVAATGQPASEGREIPVAIAGLRYAPQEIAARRSERVRFTVTNRDTVPHTLSFKTAGGTYRVPVAPGESRTGAPVTLDASGNPAIFCEIHSTMAATIVTGRIAGGTAPAVPATPVADSDYNY